MTGFRMMKWIAFALGMLGWPIWSNAAEPVRGPYIVAGVNYDKLMLRLKFNGQVQQEERTDHLFHDVASTIAFLSQYITLRPGDLIFTGTPGKTSDIKPGDVFEVELEGVGTLRNPVIAEQ